jgi:preprotein translocase subunit YajC
VRLRSENAAASSLLLGITIPILLILAIAMVVMTYCFWKRQQQQVAELRYVVPTKSDMSVEM